MKIKRRIYILALIIGGYCTFGHVYGSEGASSGSDEEENSDTIEEIGGIPLSRVTEKISKSDGIFRIRPSSSDLPFQREAEGIIFGPGGPEMMPLSWQTQPGNQYVLGPQRREMASQATSHERKKMCSKRPPRLSVLSVPAERRRCSEATKYYETPRSFGEQLEGRDMDSSVEQRRSSSSGDLANLDRKDENKAKGRFREMGRPKATITGCLSRMEDAVCCAGGELPSIQDKEQQLAAIMPILIKKYFYAILPAFVDLTLHSFEVEITGARGLKNSELEEIFNLSLVDPDTFQYVTRDQRPAKVSVAIYGYAEQSIEGKDGILNKIKRNVMDEIVLWLSALISPQIPGAVIQQVEHFLDDFFRQMMSPLKQAMFTVLKNFKDEFDENSYSCCWKRCKKITPATRARIADGVAKTVGAVVDHFVGNGFSAGVVGLAGGLWNAFHEMMS
ncbi:MAG: hypothetical protein LBN94_01060 [Puniceicoccales bacterium]|jgi:hypothetical protein|nr:hypothetical protein [Puniceicoccales bacterium]